MPFVPCANVAQVQLIGQTDGQETVNDLFFVSTAPPITAVSLATLIGNLGSWYVSQVAPNLSETWIYDHARGRDLTSQFSFVGTNTAGSGTPGGISGEQAPSNVTSNITFGTTLAGRNNHGSNRLPALPNSVITLNTIDTGWLNAILTAYNMLVAPSTTLPGGWTWVVLSRFSGSTLVDGKKVPTPRVAGIFHEVFDPYFTDNIVDSQKTRLPKRGR
jgi:hypothetical protein